MVEEAKTSTRFDARLRREFAEIAKDYDLLSREVDYLVRLNGSLEPKGMTSRIGDICAGKMTYLDLLEYLDNTDFNQFQLGREMS